MKVKIKCDCCEKIYYLTLKQKYDLERDGWLIYCEKCFQKTHLTKIQAVKDKIKIYKM
jgi:hypothetical protein